MLLTRTASHSARKIPIRSGAQVETALLEVPMIHPDPLSDCLLLTPQPHSLHCTLPASLRQQRSKFVRNAPLRKLYHRSDPFFAFFIFGAASHTHPPGVD
jgi:hypothetical protein